jgi:hypothetical protein
LTGESRALATAEQVDDHRQRGALDVSEHRDRALAVHELPADEPDLPGGTYLAVHADDLPAVFQERQVLTEVLHCHLICLPAVA